MIVSQRAQTLETADLFLSSRNRGRINVFSAHKTSTTIVVVPFALGMATFFQWSAYSIQFISDLLGNEFPCRVNEDSKF